MLIDLHDAIPGWLYVEQMEWLARAAARHSRILEVGAWAGRSADVLARAGQGHLWVVDSWSPSDPGDDTTKSENDTGIHSPEDARRIYYEWVGHRRDVTTLEMTSAEAYARHPELSFDMVWLDADHRYAHVAEDIRMWRSRLLPGGLLCGHDAELQEVRRAVDDLVPAARFHETEQPPPFDFRPSMIWYAEG